MTIIVGLLTKDYVALVADRPLSTDSGSVVEDNSSKAVLWCKKAVLGYAGSSNR